MQTPRSLTVIIGLSSFVLCVFSTAISQPPPVRDTASSVVPPYRTHEQPAAPRLFEEGTISTEEDEIGGAFSEDGTEFYFTRMVPYTTLPRLGIMCISRYRQGHWSAPEVLPFSGTYVDFPPKFSADGKRLLFASSRPLPGGTRGGLRIWSVERIASGWGEPVPLPPPINAAGSFWNADPSESRDGTLYFSSDRGGDGGLHIYRSRLADGKYSDPEKLGPEINSAFNDFQPFISPDGRLLIFASVGAGAPPYDHRPEELGTGGKPYPRADLYISQNIDGHWTPARHLEHGINSFAEEQFPFVTPDGQYLFFSSERSPFSVPTAHRLDYKHLESGLHSVFNGHGNVFFIGIEALEVKP